MSTAQSSARSAVQAQPSRARPWKKLSDSNRALLAVASAILNALVEHGNTQVSGINVTYPHARFFETYITDDMPSVEWYVDRWMRYTVVSNVFIVVAIIYIRRVAVARPAFVLSKWNFHRVFAASATVAAKYWDEHAHDQESYARLAGVVTADKMDELENSFLHLLRETVTVSMRKIRSEEISLIRKALETNERDAIRAILEEEDVEIP